MPVERENWVGKVENLVVTKEGSATDWVIARLSNDSADAPDWFALELSHRTPTSMAIYNLLRDAKSAGEPVRLVVTRDKGLSPDWQQAIIIAAEFPRLPSPKTFQ
jgi:hypothetical protein